MDSELRSERDALSDVYFGRCPECQHTDGYYNLGREHWFVCDEHETRWLAGENLFSSWRSQSAAKQEKDFDKVWGKYREVEPVYELSVGTRAPAHERER